MSGNVFDLDNMIRKRYYVDNKSDLSEITFELNDQVYVINDNQLYQVQVTGSGLVLYKINTRSPAAIEYKGSVATIGDLPLTGNTLGNMYIVQQNGHMYIWKSNNSSGTIDDWVDNGPGVDMSGYQEKITASGILKGDGNGGVSAAVAGTDYDTASNIVSATAAMTPEQAAQTVQNLGIPMAVYPGVDLTQKFAAEIANYTDEWDWVHARTQAGNYAGINISDYIPVTANGNTFKAKVMGINTYKGYGDVEVGNHIDWCFEELWPTLKPINPANYNNGLIPKENVVANGTDTSFILTKEMNDVAKIEMGGSELSGWSYDPATYTVTFAEAPSAGTMTVTGTGTGYSWLASDAYHFANSLAGQVPNGTDLNPAVIHVDYTQSGIYYYLPKKLKDVIIKKRMYLPQRYSATGVISNPNTGGWVDIGYIWFPTECEVYGTGVWANTAYETMGSALQYPIFAGNMNRLKKRSGSRSYWWLLSAYSSNSSNWCFVASYGSAYSSYASNTNVAMPVCFRTA